MTLSATILLASGLQSFKSGGVRVERSTFLQKDAVAAVHEARVVVHGAVRACRVEVDPIRVVVVPSAAGDHELLRLRPDPAARRVAALHVLHHVRMAAIDSYVARRVCNGGALRVSETDGQHDKSRKCH